MQQTDEHAAGWDMHKRRRHETCKCGGACAVPDRRVWQQTCPSGVPVSSPRADFSARVYCTGACTALHPRAAAGCPHIPSHPTCTHPGAIHSSQARAAQPSQPFRNPCMRPPIPPSSPAPTDESEPVLFNITVAASYTFRYTIVITTCNCNCTCTRRPHHSRPRGPPSYLR